MRSGEIAVLLRSRLEEGEVDHKDLGTARSNSWNIQKVNVILSECHDRLVTGSTPGRTLDIVPWNSSSVGLFEDVHFENEQFPIRQGIEVISVMVKDGDEVGGVKFACSH